MNKVLVGSDGELGTGLGNDVSPLGNTTAGALADGSDDLVKSRVEGLILVGLRLHLKRVSVLSRTLSLDGRGRSEGVAVASGRSDLNEHLTSSSRVGNHVGQVNVEGSSLNTLGRRDSEGLDGTAGISVRGAHLHGHADGNRIRVKLLQDGSELETVDQNKGVREAKRANQRKRLKKKARFALRTALIPWTSQYKVQISASNPLGIKLHNSEQPSSMPTSERHDQISKCQFVGSSWKIGSNRRSTLRKRCKEWGKHDNGG